MSLTIETEQEEDGRWIAAVPQLPGTQKYGASREEAIRQVQALALRVIADRLEHGEPISCLSSVLPRRGMSQWPTAKARKVLAALLRLGWRIKREASGSHKVLERAGYSDYVFAFHGNDEIGPKMLARIGKDTGLTPNDL